MLPYLTSGLIVLVCVVLLIALWSWRAHATQGFTTIQWVLLMISRALVRYLWRAQLPDRWPLPADTGAIIVCNHRSSVDPFFIQAFCNRPIHWMVAREYCSRGIFGWALRQCCAIPVGRGGVDTAAVKIAISRVSQGGLVGMLPEGRINVTEDLMLPVRPGAILVALRSRAPIVPCYLEGSPYKGTVVSPFMMRARTKAFVGDPIDLSEFYDQADDPELVRALTIRVVKEIARLAGQPDYEPKLAGRRWKFDDSETAENEGESE